MLLLAIAVSWRYDFVASQSHRVDYIIPSFANKYDVVMLNLLQIVLIFADRLLVGVSLVM
jgi:hypothetical protein